MSAWFFGKKDFRVAQEEESSDFVSLSSHALRSPLSIIKWYTEILLDGDAGPLTEDQRKYLSLIESSNQRAIDLVRSLLNVSRLELDTFSVSPEESDLKDVIASVIETLKESADKKHVTLEQDTQEGAPHVVLDKHLVSMILKILLGNAITFSREGGGVRTALTQLKEGEEIGGNSVATDSIIISVADSGIGIPEADKSKIFSKMFRAGNVKDTEGSDSGLGLYIVKAVLDRVGGQVWFSSQENVGTTFYVALPLEGMKKKEGRTTLD